MPLRSVRLGENELSLHLHFHAETDLEAIYLLGAFGVVLDADFPRLTALPDRLEPRDVTTQGLPFYSGRITYHLPVAAAEARDVRLEVGAFGGAVAQVRAPGAESGTLIAWPPWIADIPARARGSGEVWCDIWLTRRNTFGPLHLTPRSQPAIGPQSFRSEGETFTREYVLEPSGLLEAPRLLTRGR